MYKLVTNCAFEPVTSDTRQEEGDSLGSETDSGSLNKMTGADGNGLLQASLPEGKVADYLISNRCSRRKKTMRTNSRSRNTIESSFLMAFLVILAVMPGVARDKYETIDATASGTGTQMGHVIGVTGTIYDFSTPEDRQILVDAFEKGQNKGLSSALQKMKAVGHIAITGTIGYDISYIKMTPTPTGRNIRFATNRKITFGEAFSDSPTMSFDLTAGEIDINDHDKNKSTGKLYPAAQLVLNSEGQLQFELNQNPWNLVDIID